MSRDRKNKLIGTFSYFLGFCESEIISTFLWIKEFLSFFLIYLNYEVPPYPLGIRPPVPRPPVPENVDSTKHTYYGFFSCVYIPFT